MNTNTPRTNDLDLNIGADSSLRRRADKALELCRELEIELGLKNEILSPIQHFTAEEQQNWIWGQLMNDHDGFLAYIQGELAKWPCKCANHDPAATPPMMWPEWVACIVQKAIEDDRGARFSVEGPVCI